MSGPVALHGVGRDIRTREDGAVDELDGGRFDALVDVTQGQVIASLDVGPDVPGTDALVGTRARSGFRKHLNELAAAHGLAGSVLFQLLDDIPGSTLVSAYAPQLAFGSDDLEPRDPERAVQVMLGMVDICAGWRSGGTPLSSVD